MTVSLFDALGALRGLLAQNLATITVPQADSVLQGLREHPGLRDLESLNQLTEPGRLVGLLFHDDRYELVRERLNLAPDSLREVFGGETRANRLLPASSSMCVVPANWRNRHFWKSFQDLLQVASDDVTRQWRLSKVRRIAPRAKEPIRSWITERALFMGLGQMLVECSARIFENADGVEDYRAQTTIKITDMGGTFVKSECLLKLVQSPLLELAMGRVGSFESRFGGVLSETDYAWQAWHTPGNLSFVFDSPPFPRRRPEDLREFFRSSTGVSKDILGFLLASSEI